MPLSWPSWLSFVSSAAGDSFSPSIATGSPFSKSTVMIVALSGASSGEIADELLAQILDEDVFRLHAQRLGLAPRGLDLFALAEVCGEGHDLRVIFGLQPFEDD